MTMPPDPNVLLAQARDANGQADVKDAAAQRLRAEGDAVAHRVDFVMQEVRSDVGTGGAARTCRKEADARAGQLPRAGTHRHGWADVANSPPLGHRSKASTSCPEP